MALALVIFVFVTRSKIGRAMDCAIRTDDAFKNQVTGAFDPETYRSLLQQNGLSEREYEDGLRGGLKRRQIISATAAGGASRLSKE